MLDILFMILHMVVILFMGFGKLVLSVASINPVITCIVLCVFSAHIGYRFGEKIADI